MCARSVLVALIVAASAWACGARADQRPPQTTQTVVWRQLGSWSGHGSTQTESFTSDTGTLRVRWETRPQASADTERQLAFRLTAHSAISGRPLQELVDQPGAGMGYVEQDPHVFYMVVQSSQVDWNFTVEEAIGVSSGF